MKRRPLVSWQISESDNKPEHQIHEDACMDVPGCYIKHMKLTFADRFLSKHLAWFWPYESFIFVISQRATWKLWFVLTVVFRVFFFIIIDQWCFNSRSPLFLTNLSELCIMLTQTNGVWLHRLDSQSQHSEFMLVITISAQILIISVR